jgi:IS30 family transposase
MLPEELRNELTNNLPVIMDIQDICSILNVSWDTVHRELRRPGGLKGYQDASGEWNINRADFLAYLSRNAS